MNRQRFFIPIFRIKLTNFRPALLLTLLLAACSALMEQPLGTATPVPPTETTVPSPTIVWFPPTETPTRLARATATSTPELRPGLGVVTASDDFSNPANWDTFESDEGIVSVNLNRLTMAAQPGVYLVSLNKKLVVTDFYVEITAQLSLCRDTDEYGVLVRAIPSAYYRFALSCDGQVRADRMGGGSRTRLQEPMLSGDVPHGIPGQVRIGVWAVGRELRLFLNDHYQFTLSDTKIATGGIGVFAHANGATPMTVIFSDLVVRDVNYAAPATPKP